MVESILRTLNTEVYKISVFPSVQIIKQVLADDLTHNILSSCQLMVYQLASYTTLGVVLIFRGSYFQEVLTKPSSINHIAHGPP